MKKNIFIIFIIFIPYSFTYSQLLPAPSTFDIVPGPDSSTPIVDNDYPYYQTSGVPFSGNSLEFFTTTNDIDVFSLSSSTLTRLEFEQTLPKNQSIYLSPQEGDNFSNVGTDKLFMGVVNALIINLTNKLFARGNATGITLGLYNRNLEEVKDEVVVSEVWGIIDIIPTFNLGYGVPAGFSVIGFGNVNGSPSVISKNILTQEMTIQELIGIPVATNIIYFFGPERVATPNVRSEEKISSAAELYDGGYIYFIADDGIHGQELWTSDGTTVGTYMVKDINPPNAFGNPSSYASNLTAMNNKLYFSAYSQSGGALWVSDGTELGTRTVKSFNPTGNSTIGELININDMLYFRVSNGTSEGYEMWKSDGTEAGTVMIKDIYQAATNYYGAYPQGFTLFNGLIYFSANDGIHGNSLWVTDGTDPGTHIVKNINNTGDGSIGSLIIMPGIPNGNVFYFYADDGVHGNELWVSDGTREGTQLAYDLNPGPNDSNIYAGWGRNVGGNLYVSADNGVIGNEMFVFENVPTSAPTTSFSLKVFLEGAYVSNSMSTNLTTSIPLSQPFNNAEGDYYGDESISSTFAAANNIVDWVVVELRSGASASEATTIVAQKAVLVNSDGNLVDLDGSLDIDFKWVEAGDYYVSVHHRNHLAIMSSQFVTLSNL